MASPRPKDGSLDPSAMIIHDRFIVGSHKRDGHSKGAPKVCFEGIPQGNNNSPNENSIDISFLEYDEVGNTYTKHIVLK